MPYKHYLGSYAISLSNAGINKATHAQHKEGVGGFNEGRLRVTTIKAAFQQEVSFLLIIREMKDASCMHITEIFIPSIYKLQK